MEDSLKNIAAEFRRDSSAIRDCGYPAKWADDLELAAEIVTSIESMLDKVIDASKVLGGDNSADC